MTVTQLKFVLVEEGTIITCPLAKFTKLISYIEDQYSYELNG